MAGAVPFAAAASSSLVLCLFFPFFVLLWVFFVLLSLPSVYQADI